MWLGHVGIPRGTREADLSSADQGFSEASRMLMEGVLFSSLSEACDVGSLANLCGSLDVRFHGMLDARVVAFTNSPHGIRFV